MAFRLDPRGDLPLSNIHPSSYYTDRRGIAYSMPVKKPKQKQCYDWIFSTASNVHIAIDRSAFNTYVSFKSYILTIADQSQVTVRGIGTVEIKIRRAPGNKESHTIRLENVLHVPDWMCNIMSDICFLPEMNYEHTWTEFGVNFFVRENGKFRPWGYTENFCGLDRLILSRRKQGRSPMLEDPDREVFSVSVTWPQSQQDKWTNYLAEEMRFEAGRIGHTSRKQKADEEARVGKREAKSVMVEPSKWKLMPDLNKSIKQSMSGIVESSGRPSLLPRGSSLMFETRKA
ncbi:hypothetical protein PV05_06620 [Exophiala xenobiotica]|uniref:Retrovirus-related Pol polyprotein from transposon TNT 1-94-like beta-barrel domain-containing protein n=1 Tax=Exophiala xenobiotica TaxID=348802 RepID=A0A0D2BNU8_9EURO|nr:uncharacterized protein PV05_06620 [Exophiala xenobiotica]KIW54251.1 hypothetical protein PV05_06620 [Exophiala xenobiotica]